MWRKRLQVVRSAAPGNRLLDVGAGIGTFLALARDSAGWEVAGTEVSESAMALARRRYGIHLVQGQAEDIELGSARFDIVTLWHVLEHVPSPMRLLEVCHEALAPGGLLVVAVPNDSESRVGFVSAKERIVHPIRRKRVKNLRYYPLRPDAEIHLSHFSPNTLVQLLRHAGFET
ncbi:MAG TPA: class I SAM-dependent methyltransferase, partial [Dehalococcoidia bacterium]